MSEGRDECQYPTLTNSKRQKVTEGDQEQPLLAGLPDHLAQLCLFEVHPRILYRVCQSWRRLIYSPPFPPFLSLYTLLSSESNSSVNFFAFDPISSKWDSLPSPPQDPPLHLLLHHPSFLSRKLPIQSVSVSGKLVLLAATTNNFYPALTRPLIFNPTNRNWVFGPPFLTPRRWCAAGSIGSAVYVASGIGYQFSTDVARSVEKWNLKEHGSASKKSSYWEKMTPLKDGRFSREAIDAVGWRGKLCTVNVKGDAAKEGLVYDVDSGKWEDMPEGMLKGWRGPVAAMDEEVMYMVDGNNGTLRKYRLEIDDWSDVIIESDLLKGAQHIAAAGGRVCVVCEGSGIVVVNVTALPPRLWVVDTPPGLQPLTVHILPRMSAPVSHHGY